MKNRVFIAIIVFIVLLIAGAYVGPILLFDNRSLPNLFLEGIEVGNLDSNELRQKIDNISADFEKKQIKIAYGTKVQTLTYGQLGLIPKKEVVFQQIYTYGKKGFILKRWEKIFYVLKNRIDFTLDKEINKEKTLKILYELTQKQAIKPKNAELVITDNDQVVIIPATYGKEADIPKALEQIENAVMSSQKTKDQLITIIDNRIKPEIIEDDIEKMRITGKVAQVVSYFDPTNKERTHNIKIASKKLNDYMIPPDTTFSFNDVIGPRTKEAGYKEALVIVENVFEPGLGGGICQVSSTLYNAALKANLEIKERRRHSLLVTYVPAGLDATVVYDYLDLKFRNNTDGYLWIKSYVSGNSMIVKIFGWKEKIPNVVISRIEKIVQPQVEIIEDTSLLSGEEVVVEKGKIGYTVQVIRTLKDSKGKILSQEIISKDTYPAKKRIVRKGIATPLPENETNQEKQLPESTELNVIENTEIET